MMGDNMLKEKYNIFKGVVGLFDSKLSASVIVVLILMNVYQFVSRQNSDARLYGMVIEEVRKRVPEEVNKKVAPIIASQDSVVSSQQKVADAVDTFIVAGSKTIARINKVVNKK